MIEIKKLIREVCEEILQNSASCVIVELQGFSLHSFQYKMDEATQ